MEIAIVPATPEEAHILTDVAFRAKASWGYPEAWIERWRDELTIQPAYLDQAVVRVARAGGRPLAFYALVPLEGRRQDWELDHFWVSPDAHGRGVGKTLLDHAVEQCRANGGRALFILSDPHAEAFYHHMGARTIGKRDASMDEHERWLPEMELTIPPG